MPFVVNNLLEAVTTSIHDFIKSAAQEKIRVFFIKSSFPEELAHLVAKGFRLVLDEMSLCSTPTLN